MREHLPSLSAAGVEMDTNALSSVGWTVAQFDDAVTLKQLGYSDGNDCEPRYHQGMCDCACSAGGFCSSTGRVEGS